MKTEAARLKEEEALLALYHVESRARARALGLDELTMRDCPRLDALYADLNASGLDWYGPGMVGSLHDGRVVFAGERFWWVGT